MPCLPQASSRSLSIGNFDGILASGATACDLGSLRFIDAYGLVGLACALQAGRTEDPALEVLPPKRGSTRDHLAAMGFDDFLDELATERMSETRDRAQDSSVVVPLAKAPSSTGEQPVIDLLWEQLRDQVGPQILGALGETGLGGRMIVRSGGGKVDLSHGGQIASEVLSLPGTIVGLSLPLYPG
jgi:hypothetical protein